MITEMLTDNNNVEMKLKMEMEMKMEMALGMNVIKDTETDKKKVIRVRKAKKPRLTKVILGSDEENMCMRRDNENNENDGKGVGNGEGEVEVESESVDTRNTNDCTEEVRPENNNTNNKPKASVHRFKFSDAFMEHLNVFSQIHKYDTRPDFKDAWENWMQENTRIIEDERTRLNELGFTGNMKDKMYKSVRYYFCKKTNEEKEPKKRRDYISMSKEILDVIDTHIETSMKENIKFKPSKGYDDFCEVYSTILENEVNTIVEHSDLSEDGARDKIKKTYKNRYYVMTH